MADFSVNSEIRDDLKKSTEEAATTVGEMKTAIENTYKSIGAEEIWKGESYNSFSSMCETFMPALEATENLLKAMAYILDEQVGKEQEVLESAVEKALNVG